MSSERPFGDSGTEHHPEPDHPRPTEEAMTAVSTLNHFWRMMIDPGFPSPKSNPASFMVTTEAFSLPPRDGPRERRAPLLVRGTVHIAGPGNPRPPSIPSHPSILNGAKAVKVLLVADRATPNDSA
ncbi:hypothetical protein B296_00029216 [Ensete ventricosum]|uniref:Uncharacterized protein n=1 Tax=Ensete ventricosum TaxID=4639 RepID=A0A426XZL3_ENSVE|nr:hypothetical protein B296_00029216 [Ensete ventricosum]